MDKEIVFSQVLKRLDLEDLNIIFDTLSDTAFTIWYDNINIQYTEEYVLGLREVISSLIEEGKFFKEWGICSQELSISDSEIKDIISIMSYRLSYLKTQGVHQYLQLWQLSTIDELEDIKNKLLECLQNSELFGYG